MKNLVSIIILNYNNNDYIIECLNSLRKQTYKNFEVIIIDNGSKYNLYLELKKKIDRFEIDFRIILIRSDVNLYFSGGNNKGIKIASGDYICLLNNDTEVMPNFIEKMVSFLESHDDAGMICPKIKFFEYKNILWYSGAKIEFKNPNIAKIEGLGQFDSKNKKYIKITQTGFAAGTALFLKREVIDKIGLLDDAFLMYHEDVDWNLRANKEGYKSYYVPTTIVYHKISKGKNSRKELFAGYFVKRNSQIFAWKQAKFKELLIFYFYFLLHCFKEIGIYCLFYNRHKNFYLIFLQLNAMWDGFRIGVKRRTNRSCRKNILKDYKFIIRNQKKIESLKYLKHHFKDKK